MRFIVGFVSIVLWASSASATCSTYGAITSCSDGNTYTKLGNTVYGSNSRTGSTWSQSTVGSTTYGYDSDGNSWSHTKTQSGGYGYDSSGNTFSYFD